MAEGELHLTELLGCRPSNPVWMVDGLTDVCADLHRHPELLSSSFNAGRVIRPPFATSYSLSSVSMVLAP